MGRSVLGKVVIELSPQDGLAAIWRPDAGPHSEESQEDPSSPAQNPPARKPPVAAPLPLRAVAPSKKVESSPRAETSAQDGARTHKAGQAKSESESALAAKSQPVATQSASFARRKQTPPQSTSSVATPAAATGAKEQKRVVASTSSSESSSGQRASEQATATPAAATETDAVPLAFDFIDTVASTPPGKPAATRRKLSAVVSVPNAQAQAAQKSKEQRAE
jgi:hypothetical protein